MVLGEIDILSKREQAETTKVQLQNEMKGAEIKKRKEKLRCEETEIEVE